MTHETFFLREQARALCFKVLSECYFLPSSDLLQRVTELEKHLALVDHEAMRHVSHMKDELENLEDLDSLRADYARLFVGPYKLSAPPYGSVYLDGERKVMGISTNEVREAYREAGLDVSKEFHDLPDHISAELEFMYYLVFKEIERSLSSDLKGMMAYLTRQRAFLRSYLGSWMAQFTGDVEQEAGSNFYRNLARCTRLFVEENLKELRELDLTELQGSASEESIASSVL
jgi:TorA maturation chaperone TorD